MICEYKNCNKEVGNRKGKRFCSRNCKQKNCQAKDPKRQKKYENFVKGLRPYIKYRKNKCENCGFIPLHICQLDVDHIDGNHNNNEINNLQTLCANCHRLKTQLNKDWQEK